MNITLTEEQRDTLEKQIDSRWNEVLKMKGMKASIFVPDDLKIELKNEYIRFIKEIIFIKKAKIIHGDKYDYKFVYYNDWKTKVIIICPEHGEFEIMPNSHLNQRSGCPKCAGQGLSTEEWIDRFREVHCGRYSYDRFVFKANSIKSIVTCSEHGDFLVTPSHHLSQKQGCSKCNNSKGEIQIENYLKQNNIKYETQKRFDGCKHKQTLPFDFYLPDYNLLIEFQGEQHYKIIKHFGGEKKFKQNQKRDQIKRDFCSKPENPNLLEIPYKKIKEISSILEKNLKIPSIP